jgi:pyridoxal phosphate enzyme, YggS family
MNIEENIKDIIKCLNPNVTLIAVSKTRTIEEMIKVYNAGVINFGENKVQEFLDKYEKLPADIKWHIIGHLQTNKVKYIAGKVFLIHSLDSVKLLNEIERQYSKLNQTAEVLIQINIGREESKDGILLENLDFLLEKIEESSHVKVRGLMSIIPIGDENSCKYYFSEMKKLWDKLKLTKYKNISMEYLSMGMTSDYRTAVHEGSNMVRIGEGIFGKRIYNNK